MCGDKLVGELNNVETLCHLIITNNLENGTVIIPSPFNYHNTISIYIGFNKKTKNKVSFVNDFPFIESNVSLIGTLLSMDDTVDLTNPDALETLNSYVNTFFEDAITSYLYKTSKEYKSDIADFGRYALPKYLTWKDWTESDWLNNYENAFFKVSVDTKIQGGYLFTKF